MSSTESTTTPRLAQPYRDSLTNSERKAAYKRRMQQQVTTYRSPFAADMAAIRAQQGR